MSLDPHCPCCKKPLPHDARDGLCPACLLANAMVDSKTTTLDEHARGGQTLPGAARNEDQWPRIARYRILQLIDVGGMGEVYAAEQQQPRRTVALKVIRAGIATHRNLQRFAYEAEALARLHHPGIAQVYESGTADSGSGVVPFFAMELVRGAGDQRPPTLTRYATEHKLGTRQRLELLCKVADAVHHAHQNGVIHRDLKPSNVLVDENGQPKVLDFGVARVTDADIQTATLQTDIGQIIGTLPYMSPEQASGDPAQVDTRTDVYGLGALAYELLVGRPPLEMSKLPLPEAVRVIREEEPKTLSSIERSLRGDVETIVAKALAKEKERRYASAAEFAADIRRYLHSEPIAARRASPGYQLAKFTRRNKATVSGVISTFIVLLAGIAVAISLAAEARHSAANATHREHDAKAAQVLAETRFNLSSHFARRYADFDDVLADLAGGGMARRGLNLVTVEYLEQLLKTSPNDTDAQLQLLTGYHSAGMTEESNTGPTDQNLTRALDYYHKGLAIADALSLRLPDNIRVELFQMRLISAIGRLQRLSRQPDESTGGAKVLELAEKFNAAHPEDRLARRELAAALLEHAEVERQHDETTSSKQHLDRARNILGALPKPRVPIRDAPLPKTPDFVADVKELPEAWRDLYVRASCHHRQGVYADAVELYRQALEFHGDPSPDDFIEFRDCCYIQMHVYDCFNNWARFDDAFSRLVACRNSFARIPEPHPPGMLNLEAYILLYMAQNRQSVGKMNETVNFYGGACHIFAGLAQADPADDKARRAYTNCQCILASALELQGDFRMAMEGLRHGMRQLSFYVAQHPKNVEALRDLLTLERSLGDSYRIGTPELDNLNSAGARTTALDYLRRSKEWYEAAWSLASTIPEMETPIFGVDSPVTLSPRITLCDGRIDQCQKALAPQAPADLTQFYCDYHLPSDPPGPRKWKKISPSAWSETQLSDQPTTDSYELIGPGNLLRRKDGKMEAMFPTSAAPGEAVYLKIRPAGQSEWRTVGLIHLAE